MSRKAESVESHPPGDWDTPFRAAPESSVGEFSRRGANPVVADLSAPSFTETARTPHDGFTGRDESNFRTTDSTKRG